jgi:hypothetical protein
VLAVQVSPMPEVDIVAWLTVAVMAVVRPVLVALVVAAGLTLVALGVRRGW